MPNNSPTAKARQQKQENKSKTTKARQQKQQQISDLDQHQPPPTTTPSNSTKTQFLPAKH